MASVQRVFPAFLRSIFSNGTGCGIMIPESSTRKDFSFLSPMFFILRFCGSRVLLLLEFWEFSEKDAGLVRAARPAARAGRPKGYTITHTRVGSETSPLSY